MNKPDTIIIKLNSGEELKKVRGIALQELAAEFQERYISAIIAAKVNNEIRELSYKLEQDCLVEFVDLTHSDGIRIYQRSLTFVLIKAVHDVYPERKVEIHHSLSNQGLFCTVKGDEELKENEIALIEKRMGEIVNAKLPFIKRRIPKDDARRIFEQSGRMDKFSAIAHRVKPYVTIYECGGLEDYFYGYMAPHTGYVDKFRLMSYKPGFVMLHPQKEDPCKVPEFEEQKKLFKIFLEFEKWSRILGINNTGALNDLVSSGKIAEMIRISEALHEKKLAQIADMITQAIPEKKIVLISGPSSSGKTTFAQRLSIQLRVNGVRPVTISLDDYYLPRHEIPLDEDGKPDLEALEALMFHSLMSIFIG